ncbi:44226_t:CDS:2 [Gigaspora margarita]|uniref:44226_t:CDS:1 n=1 Tax=Gigaspora margarita TaxID=4874 RepID=A0ABM8W6F5_GIGMA|nr:44226_t:CDS:2 [Gigaspora margarita]
MRTGSNKVAIDPFIRRDPRFSELIGNISVWAINNIKRTLKKKTNPDIYENNGTCECLNKINFKLSCQYMIPKDGPIPLSMIDKRWFLERPDIIELPCSSKSSIIDPEFYSTFVKAEEKFEQLPDNMPLPEPAKLPQKVVSKKSSLSSTKRGSLLTKHQDNVMKKKILNNITKLKNKPVQQQLIPFKQSFISCSSSKLYEANILKFIHQYIFAYFDVADDSNCGFCTIAISIEKPEGFWPDVQEHIYKELCSRKSHYIQLFLEKEKEYDEVLQATHKLISLTFLPDNIPLNRNTLITFAYIFEKQHFIAIKLKPNMPIPPIVKEQHEKECEYLQKENIINLIDD